jgi:hypothetical protein
MSRCFKVSCPFNGSCLLIDVAKIVSDTTVSVLDLAYSTLGQMTNDGMMTGGEMGNDNSSPVPDYSLTD